MISILRENYWVLNARRIAKSVIRSCVPCQRIDAGALNQIAAPLPSYRVNQSKPFAVTGIDFCGPLFCKGTKTKYYILLFTCAVVRAVHLELTSGMSLKDVLLAINRFTARRGVPERIISDNARQSAQHLRKRASAYQPAPVWQFIPPHSPKWGGWYERLIGSVKSSLKKSIGAKSLKREGLEVALH